MKMFATNETSSIYDCYAICDFEVLPLADQVPVRFRARIS